MAAVVSRGFPRWIRKDNRTDSLGGASAAALWQALNTPFPSPQPTASPVEFWVLPDAGATDRERNRICPALVVASAPTVSTR